MSESTILYNYFNLALLDNNINVIYRLYNEKENSLQLLREDLEKQLKTLEVNIQHCDNSI